MSLVEVPDLFTTDFVEGTALVSFELKVNMGQSGAVTEARRVDLVDGAEDFLVLAALWVFSQLIW